MQYLPTLFPDADLALTVGLPLWGGYMTWLSWYQGMLDPVLVMDALDVAHLALPRPFRSHTDAAAPIRAALVKEPWLPCVNVFGRRPFGTFDLRVLKGRDVGRPRHLGPGRSGS